MPLSARELEHIERKAREFLDAVLVAKWTKPAALDELDALEAGRKVGLDPILVSEFLIRWVNSGDLDGYFEQVAKKVRERIPPPRSARRTPQSETVVARPTTTGAYDPFISHASEDKDAVARPLYEALTKQSLSVWFDEAELRLGDSLRGKIDEGLARCRYGVVILSPWFLAKEWPQRELDGLVARETASGEKAILPIWHELDAATLTRYSPTLAGRVAAKSDKGIPVLVAEIVRALQAQHGGTRIA
jgi:hypothetical protein